MFKIGNIELKNNIVLAPMAGISNPAYIKICEEMGLGYAVTELISAEAVVRNNKKTFEMLNGIDNLNIPIAIQIFGSDAKTISKAARILIDLYQIKLIDINMGCPVPKVALRSHSGSALLKNPEKVKEIVESVVETVDIPVTVKIRSGWDSNSINAIEIAKIIEKAGASAITIHPRTRAQGYSGKADWNIIKEVKENVSIPVIGNGDIKSCYDAKRMLDETNCDAIMIGRGLIGNPWLIKECIDYIYNNKEPIAISNKEKLEMILHHLDLLNEYKNTKVALLEMRSHASWYLKGIPNTANLKQEIFKVKEIAEFKNLIYSFMREEGYEC
jgi:nifR3 family TIM-barrel protein